MKKALVLLCLFLSLNVIAQRKIVVIGSSSAAGYNVPADSGWVARLAAYCITNNIADQVINLAEASTSVNTGMPNWFVAPAGRDTVKRTINITKAISYQPIAIIVNYPSNDFDWLPDAEIINDFAIIKASADSAHIPCFITTTQPRSAFSNSEQLKLKGLADQITSTFGKYSLPFFYAIAVAPWYGINPAYALSDSIHLNSAGHKTLFDQVVAANIFGHQVDARSDTTTTSADIAMSYKLNNLKNGKYKVVLSVYDSSGNAAYDSVFVVKVDTTQTPVPPPPPPPPQQGNGNLVKVNLYATANPYNTGNWNNWSIPTVETNNIQSASFIYDDGTTSTINCLLSQSAGVADNGATYGGVMCPQQVLRYASFSTSQRTLTIKGLNNVATYDIELYSSRANTGNSTTFTINGVAQTVNTSSNLSNKVVYANLSPTNGQIVISISKVGTYNYLNGFMITEKYPQ